MQEKVRSSMKKFATLSVPTIALLLAACGGGGRPSADELSKALNDHSNKVAAEFTSAFSDASAGTVDCIAQVLHDSKVSDGSLKAVVDGDEGYKGTRKDSHALQAATVGMAKCLTK